MIFLIFISICNLGGYFQLFLEKITILKDYYQMSESWKEDSEIRRLKAECERLGGVVKVLEKGI